ncbi:MAG: hypothetical protein JWQ09_1135 [Segetibacter sp.]|nr:hypothetical protein [Segetibacter sp.]
MFRQRILGFKLSTILIVGAAVMFRKQIISFVTGLVNKSQAQ